MFNNLFVYSYKRSSFKEAAGFYIFYLLLFLLVAALLGAIFALTGLIKGGFQGGSIVVGSLFGVIATLYLSIRIAADKKILNQPASIMLIVLSGLISIIGGAVFSLLIVSYMTTKDSPSSSSDQIQSQF